MLGSALCRALVCTGLCAGSGRTEQRCSQSCLRLPQEPPEASISHHIFLASGLIATAAALARCGKRRRFMATVPHLLFLRQHAKELSSQHCPTTRGN